MKKIYSHDEIAVIVFDTPLEIETVASALLAYAAANPALSRLALALHDEIRAPAPE